MKLEQHVHDWIDAGWLAFSGERKYSKECAAALVSYYNWVNTGLLLREEDV